MSVNVAIVTGVFCQIGGRPSLVRGHRGPRSVASANPRRPLTDTRQKQSGQRLPDQ